MLNAVCETNLKSVDYKSIALPAELQGLVTNNRFFSLKDQINQSLKNIIKHLLSPCSSGGRAIYL